MDAASRSSPPARFARSSPRSRGAVLATTLIIALPAALIACDASPRTHSASRARELMGTLATVTALAPTPQAASAAVDAAYRRLDAVNGWMSDYDPNSDIGRLNRAAAGAAVSVSPHTLACVDAAIRYGRLSGGAFDITVRPLVSLWRKAGAAKRMPADADLAAARALVGYHDIALDPGACALALPREGMQIDLGGIAVGYALDYAAEAMREAGAASGLIDVGGDVLAFGAGPEGDGWRVGVKNPFGEGLLARLLLRDMAVTTSGKQQRFYEIDGHRYSHIIDPRTGLPAEQAPCVVVIARMGIDADAWATALSVLGIEEGGALLAGGTAPGAEAMWITGDNGKTGITNTPGFPRYVTTDTKPGP